MSGNSEWKPIFPGAVGGDNGFPPESRERRINRIKKWSGIGAVGAVVLETGVYLSIQPAWQWLAHFNNGLEPLMAFFIPPVVGAVVGAVTAMTRKR